jgi:hypothetical protein
MYYTLLHLTGKNAWTVPFFLGHISPGVKVNLTGVNEDFSNFLTIVAMEVSRGE